MLQNLHFHDPSVDQQIDRQANRQVVKPKFSDYDSITVWQYDSMTVFTLKPYSNRRGEEYIAYWLVENGRKKDHNLCYSKKDGFGSVICISDFSPLHSLAQIGSFWLN